MKRIHEEEDDLDPPTKPYQEWRRGRVLGQGTFGMVHMAEPTEPRAPRFRDFPPVMAVKSSHANSSKSDLENERFLLKKLSDCPHIIRYLGDEETPEASLNVFLEYAAGGTLAAAELPLDEATVRRHTRSILLGVKRIHEEGLVHCDLKPENILLVREAGSGRLTAKVADLGMAAAEETSDDDEGFYDHERRERGVKGTMVYLSPESALYNRQGQPSDLWALGCIVLRMFGGELPWDRCERGDIRRRIASVAPTLPPGLSPEARDFLGKCFSRNPWERGSAESLLRHPFIRGQEPPPESLEKENINVVSMPLSFVTGYFWPLEEKKEDQESIGDDSSKQTQWVMGVVRDVMLRCARFCDDIIKSFASDSL